MWSATLLRCKLRKETMISPKRSEPDPLLPFYSGFIMNKSGLEELRGKELKIFSFVY